MKNLKLKTNPLDDGYTVMSNFDKSKYLYLLWPERGDVWMNNGKNIYKLYKKLLKIITKYEKITIGVNDIQRFNKLNFKFNDNVKVVQIDYEDAWLGDTGPNGLIGPNGDHRATAFGFNCWGGEGESLYEKWDNDALIARRICENEGIKYYEDAKFMFEGGSIISNGKGTLITTEECLLNPNRNPNLTKDEIEDVLKRYLGVKKVIWLKRGLKHDETNGHVDNVCNFLTETDLVVAWEDDPDDIQYEILMDNYNTLKNETTWDGKPINLIKVHQPRVKRITKKEADSIIPNPKSKPRLKGHVLAGTYTNMFISDKYAFVPQFKCKYDKKAVKIYKKIYKNKVIIPFNCRAVLISGGGVHCVFKKL